MTDCFAEAHRRPRFAGSILDSPSSALYKLDNLNKKFQNSQQQFTMVENVFNCTCSQHRCNMPLPSFCN